ncbi:MAG: hydrogenase maturation nickel metallochaperone HypA [Defluviitaleaceae bacterium]|nr:hydrogenase maturation nickel metallochaperone HypA [Defluviitaleaceae bacterium]
MHEYSYADHVFQTAVRFACGKKVEKISLAVGEAAGVSPEILKTYFALIAEGTECGGAELEIETVKPMLKCGSCGKHFVRKPFSFACVCGGDGRPTDVGRGFLIKHIETAGGQH